MCQELCWALQKLYFMKKGIVVSTEAETSQGFVQHQPVFQAIVNWARGQETRYTFGYFWYILKIWKSYKRHQNLGFVQNESYSCHPYRTTDWSSKIPGRQIIFWFCWAKLYTSIDPLLYLSWLRASSFLWCHFPSKYTIPIVNCFI